MIVVISFILNLLSPIVNLLGFMGIGVAFLVEGDTEILALTGVLAIVGLVYGILAYKNDIPPRMFWTGSVNDVFKFSVTTVLGYAFNIAMYPPCIYYIMYLIDEIA